MNKSTKTTANTSEKTSFKLTQAFALWKRKSESGFEFLNGKKGDEPIVAFYNNRKTSMKDPDIIVHTRTDEEGGLEAFCKLWSNVSKDGKKKYLSGKIGDCRVVGFYNEGHKPSQPYINVYYSEKDDE